MRAGLMSLFSGVALCSVSSIALAGGQLAVTPMSGGGFGSSEPWDWGYAFQVTVPVDVTALCYYTVSSDSDFQSHSIGIWKDATPGAPIVQAGVGAGSPMILSGPDPHAFRVAPIEPVTLFPGITYVVSGTPGFNDFMYQNTVFIPGSEIHVLEGRYGFNEGGYPSGSYGALIPLGGNFIYEVSTCAAPADFNCDGVVDGADLGTLLGAWGSCGACQADLNSDGVVDGADLGQLLGAWTV